MPTPGQNSSLGRPPTERLQIRFHFTCKMCSSVLEALSSLAGTPGRCPTCGAIFDIPIVDPHTGLARGMGDPGTDPDDPTPVHAYAAAGNKAPHIIRLGGGEYGIVCPRCRNTSDVQTNHCATCGYPFTMEGANRAAAGSSDGYSVASFVIGLLSVPCCLCHEIGGLGSLIAAALGWVSINRVTTTSQSRGTRGLAISGIVFAFCGFAIVALKQIFG